MIDYGRLDRSLKFYESFGFKRIESPWTVTKDVSDITKPPGGKDKVLVLLVSKFFVFISKGISTKRKIPNSYTLLSRARVSVGPDRLQTIMR